jgi:hypothetical protein
MLLTKVDGAYQQRPALLLPLQPTTDRQGPMTTPPAQVERLELECDRDAETDHVVRCYEPRKES